MRGAGLSEVEQTSSAKVEEHHSDISALLTELHLPAKPVVIAHSNGAFVLQKWIEKGMGNKLSGMVLLAATPPNGTSGVTRRLLFRYGLWKAWRFTLGFVKRTVATDVDVCREMFFSEKTVDGFSEQLEGDEQLAEYMAYFQTTKLMLDTSELKNSVKDTAGFRSPVLVIGGDSDQLIDEQALHESTNFWDADLIVVPNAPHNLMLYSGWQSPAASIDEWIVQNVNPLLDDHK